MTQRESRMQWLKDTLEQLQEKHGQLEWTEDPEAARMLLDGMVRDIDCAKKLCEDVKVRTPLRSVLAARCA